MTRDQVSRYLKLLAECGRAHYDLPLANSPELLRGQTKRRATLAAKRLMGRSRDLWCLLQGLDR
jgi:hypothetical protein